MKTTLLLPLVAIFLLAFLPTDLNAQWGRWRNNESVKGNGNIERSERDLNGFDGLKSCCSMEISVRLGQTYGLVVEADENILPYVITEVSQGMLSMRIQQGVNLTPSQRIKVFVSMPSLQNLEASSSSRTMVEGICKSDQLRIDISSSAKVDLHFEGRELLVEGSSSGRLELRGQAEQSRIAVSSSCQVVGNDFTSRKLRVDGSSSSRVELAVTEELRAEVSSSAKVIYSGNPTKVFTDANSGAKVQKSGL